VSPIDQHFDKFQGEQLATLQHLRLLIVDLLPTATECIKYGMPAFTVQGKAVAGIDGFKAHCSYFPHSGSVLEKAGPLPTWAEASQGTLRFPIGQRLPKALVRRLIRIRLDEISDVRNGKRFEFFDDGTVKAEGSMKDGELHGAWKWFRKDGTQMRTGRFSAGRQVGVWETWDADGRLVRSKDFGR
jgi:uncharacterized protein YdhG (YjbR/CyaY superfamily)